MENFTVELTVANHCGVLNRITGLYAKCRHNIDTLAVQEWDDPALSVIRITSRGNELAPGQMVRQLRKLFDVKTVVLLDDPATKNNKEQKKC